MLCSFAHVLIYSFVDSLPQGTYKIFDHRFQQPQECMLLHLYTFLFCCHQTYGETNNRLTTQQYAYHSMHGWDGA